MFLLAAVKDINTNKRYKHIDIEACNAFDL